MPQDITSVDSNRGSVRRRLLFILGTLALTVIAMAVSFGTIRWLTHRMTPTDLDDPVAHQRALLLRGFANEFTILCNDYARIVGQKDGGITSDTRIWIDRVFRREIRFMEQRMDNSSMPGLPAYDQLRAAVGRCASMARHPDDALLRQGALRDAARAVSGVNAHISGLHLSHWSGRTPIPVGFE